MVTLTRAVTTVPECTVVVQSDPFSQDVLDPLIVKLAEKVSRMAMVCGDISCDS